MLKLILFSTCILLSKPGSAQVSAPVPLPTPYNDAKPVTIYLRDVTGRPETALTDLDIEGSPFLNSDFEMGRVVFTNGKMSRDVYLKFDMLTNRLLFLRDGMTLEFVDPVRDFYLQHNENDKSGVVFRGNFPPIDKNTTSTFYELLVDGKKITLLNYRYKIISDYKEYSMIKKKQYVEHSQLYAVLPGNKIMRIKKDRKFLMKAMPDYADKIKSFTDKQQLRDDESIITLFEELNN